MAPIATPSSANLRAGKSHPPRARLATPLALTAGVLIIDHHL